MSEDKPAGSQRSTGGVWERDEAAADAPLFTPEQAAQIEQLSRNLARAAATAQAAIGDVALASLAQGAAPDFSHAAPPIAEAIGRMFTQPEQILRAQADLFARHLDLWHAMARRLAGEPTEPLVVAAPGDKRFRDPEWTDNPVFDAIKQSYLLTSEWMRELAAGVEGIDPLDRRRIEFFTKMLADAFAPSNFLATNPVALRELAASGGASLVRGMENFAADLARGGGRLAISQTDYERFRLGENIAVTPGKVVFRNEIIELVQYAPLTAQVFAIPLVIFPPWINKFYILDLRPENSMVRWLAEQGFTVFIASWVNPDGRLADKSFEDYLHEGVYAATQAAMDQCGAPQVNAVGYCIGGTLLSAALAHMAAKGDARVASATFFAAQQDFSEAGDLQLFTGNDWLAEVERQMQEAGGVLPGQAMAEVFNALRANDLIWSFFVNNYLLGKDPQPFDLLFWNADQTRMPRRLHLFYLRRFYGENALAKGEMELDGVRLDLGAVKTPVYVQASREDHIAPARSVYKGATLFGGPVSFTLAGSGHIAGVINPPAANKYQHWTAPELPATFEAWQGQAAEQTGSWWPHWAVWLTARSGAKVAARDPAKGPLPPLGEAPGEYVRVRS